MSGRPAPCRCDYRCMSSPVDFALLCRTPKEWRITVRTTEELACGALEETSSAAPCEAALREFEALLVREWGVSGPFTWDEFKPGWWGAEWIPGALDSEKNAGP